MISFSIVALALGAITRIFDFDPNILRDGATLLLVAFGLLMIWPTPFERLSIHLRGLFATGASTLVPPRDGNLGGFVLGSTLGLVWTPCAGPVLGSILTLIAASGNAAWASVQLLAYAIGAAIPMLAIAYGGQRITGRVRSLAQIAPRLQQGFGVVVIAFAAATYLHYDTAIVVWLTQFYPEGLIAL